MSILTNEAIQDKALKIKLLVLDVDGVLTDGQVHYNENGDVFRSFTVRDGTGIKNLIKSNIKIAVITGRDGNIIKKRLNELGVTTIFDNQEHKVQAFRSCVDMFNLDSSQVCYMGDDMIDLGPISLAGLSCAPNDAIDMVKSKVDYVAKTNGGKGAVREVIDVILSAQGLLDKIYFKYSLVQEEILK